MRKIYTLYGYPPEVTAVAFAKCSRSPEDFDKIANELNEDKSRKFHEKWVVGYGHSSVAEHAVLSIAMENVSILATKVIEDNRLASYTEKSSRYQQFTKERYFTPELNPELKKIYKETVDLILDKYTELIPRMSDFVKKKYPNFSVIEIKNRTFDNLRNLLPVCCLTNLGMTINARALEYAICKLLTHPLKEMNLIGDELKETALKVTPTLVKYTDYNKYLGETVKELENDIKEFISDAPDDTSSVKLVEYDQDAEEKVLSALFYRFSNLPYNQIKEKLKELSNDEKRTLIKKALTKLGKFDSPLREFEYPSYTFDVLVDYGAFRDIQRHRMMTQTNQIFSPVYGFDVPDEVTEAGMDADYVEAMKAAKKVYSMIKDEFPKEAQYILPMAFKKRVLLKADLREMFHFIKLRSTKQGHDSYRKIAQLMYKELDKVHPFLAGFIEVDME